MSNNNEDNKEKEEDEMNQIKETKETNQPEEKEEEEMNQIKETKETNQPEEKEEEKEEEKPNAKKIKMNVCEESDSENEEEKNKDQLQNIEHDKPYNSDEIKTVYKITSYEIFPEISIIKTNSKKIAPINRCYLTAEYSPTNNSIICIGGCDETVCNQYNKITEYDLSKNVWDFWSLEEQSELGFELSGHSSNLIILNKEEKIFVFGGYDNWKGEFTAQSYLINIKMKNFEKINYIIKNKEKSNELPLPRTYHTSNYDIRNNVIYIYGGTDMNINHCKGDNFQALWKFNLLEKTWNKINLKNIPQDGPPRGHSSIFLNGKLYIFGGVTLFKKFQNNLYIINIKEKNIEKLDYNNDSFKKGCIPVALAFHSAVLIDEKKFLIHGGLNKNYMAVNICYIYYIEEMKFDEIKIPLIPNLFGHKIVMNSEKQKLYIVGGFDNFKFVGDENLSYNIEKDEDDIINKNEGKVRFIPMSNILEISLKKENKEGEKPEAPEELTPENQNKEKEKENKRRKWKKLFYVNI